MIELENFDPWTVLENFSNRVSESVWHNSLWVGINSNASDAKKLDLLLPYTYLLGTEVYENQ